MSLFTVNEIQNLNILRGLLAYLNPQETKIKMN